MNLRCANGPPTKIVTGLFQSGYPLGNPADAGFDVLVLCAAEHQPDAENFPGVEVVHAPMFDEQIDLEIIERASIAASQVADLIRDGAKKVLVTCALGRNRSGLVTGLILHDLYELSGEEAVLLIQNKRKHALTNESFAEFLRELPGS